MALSGDGSQAKRLDSMAFDLHRMHDEATGIAGLVDQEDGW